MDPFSIAGSVVGIVGLGIQVSEKLCVYYNSVKDVTKTANETSDRLRRLNDILTSLNDAIELRNNHPSHGGGASRIDSELRYTQQITSSITSCEELIHELQDELDKIQNASVNGLRGSIRVAGRRILYPFRESTLRKLDESVETILSNLNLALQVLRLHDDSRVQDDISVIKQLTELVRASVLTEEVRVWLDAADAAVNHNIACATRHAKSGTWFIEGTLFRSWLEDDNSFLWINGFAGCGKSVLCSTAIQHAFAHTRGQTSTGIAFFYFTFNDVKKQDNSALLRGFLQQLACQSQAVEGKIKSLRQDSKHGMPSDLALLDCLRDVVSCFSSIYLFVDALDEVAKGKPRREVLKTINTIRSWSIEEVHMLVTSRDEVDIRDELQLKPEEEILMQSSEIDKDIDDFVADSLKNDRRLMKWKTYHDEIKQSLAQKAHGVFRWVDCQLEAIAGCPRSAKHLRQCLKDLPADLDKTYERIICNIAEHAVADAVRILTVLCYAHRPMTVSELIDAVAIDLDEPAHLNRDFRFEDADSLKEVCPTLIEIYVPSDRAYSTNADSANRSYHEANIPPSLVRIAHFSVQEYLQSARIKTGNARHFALNQHYGDEEMVRICLTYLLEPCSSANNTTKQMIEDLPFCQYAAKEWLTHYKNLPTVSDKVKQSISQLLVVDSNARKMWISLNRGEIYKYSNYAVELTDILAEKPLYYACMLSMYWLVEDLLDSEIADANGDDLGSVLLAAMWQDDERIIRTVLDLKPDLNVKERNCGNALRVAVSRHSETVVEWLIHDGADINASNDDGTALTDACKAGREKIVRMLLDRGADIEIPDRDGTPLHLAAMNCYESIVRLLLDSGADVHAGGRRCGHTIQAAARGGSLAIVTLLFARGADVKSRSGTAGTALQLASREGHKDVVEFLLKNGAEVDACGSWPQNKTPIVAAAYRGHCDIFTLLLHHGADPYKMNSVEAENAFQVLCKNGNTNMLRHLLDSYRHVNGRSADLEAGLNIACHFGHEDVVRLLIEYGAEVNVRTERDKGVLC